MAGSCEEDTEHEQLNGCCWRLVALHARLNVCLAVRWAYETHRHWTTWRPFLAVRYGYANRHEPFPLCTARCARCGCKNRHSEQGFMRAAAV